MGLTINQSIAALSTIRNLRNVQRAVIQTAERLSTGARINRASDDPAGLVISENLLEIPAQQIHKIKVLKTVFRGHTVFQAK